MINLGVVQQDSIITVPVPTRTTAGVPAAPSAEPTQAGSDFSITKIVTTTLASAVDSAALTITGTTIDAAITLDTTTGKNRVAVDLSANTDLQTAGASYELWWEADETVDSVAVVECLAVWTLESDTAKAIRTFNSAVFVTDTVVTATSNSTTVVNLTDFLDANAPANSTAGELWLRQNSGGSGTDELEYFRVQSMTATTLLATVEAWPAGGAMSAAVEAGDKLWRVGYVDVNTVAVSDTQQTANDNGADINEILVDTGTTLPAAITAINGVPTVNSAFTFQFTMHDATDGWTLEPGITVTEEVSKDGAAFAAAGGTFTEVEEGVYQFAASAGDMNCAYGSFKFTGTGCRPTVVNFVTSSGL